MCLPNHAAPCKNPMTEIGTSFSTAGYNPYDRGIHWVCEANINWSLRQDINEYL